MDTLDNWQKSSYSSFGDGDSCLELATTPAALHLRESDDPTTTPVAHLLHAIRVASL